jgi:3D (Asp-Asp-Asp) domain-containing protein
MTATASARPAGGVFAYSTVVEFGQNTPSVEFADGGSASQNPNNVRFVVPPPGPLDSGEPRAGGRVRLKATYTVGGHTILTNEQNRAVTFGMSCYRIALEAEWGTAPNSCEPLRIGNVVYAGAVTNPYGLPGTYCSSFIADVRLQGSGRLRTGGYINYNSRGTIIPIARVTGADNTPVVAGRTVARDRTIIPDRGVLVDVNGVGTGLLANDIGGRILGYRLDLFNGEGRAACARYGNPVAVGACQTAQGSTCPEGAFQ